MSAYSKPSLTAENLQKAELLTATIQELTEDLKVMEAIRDMEAQNARTLTGLPDLNIDHSTVPAQVAWSGDVPQNRPADDCRARLKSLEEQKEASASASAKVAALTDTLAEDDERIARLKAQLIEYPAADNLADLKAKSEAAFTLKLSTQDRINELQAESTEIGNQLNQAETAHRVAEDRREAAAVQVAQAKSELDELAFNNVLLKKVRAARPIIADKLWSLVLASVSTLFSSMRGEKSVVSKGKDGFSVNGQAVESLSGSTLDLLGLAIRVALTKTFLPQCPFMILDEPGAAMDDGRNAAMLGFIQGAGFSQVLLVSHEEASSALADNLIEL